MVRRIAASPAATAIAVILLSALAIFLAVKLFGLTAVGAVSLYFVIWWIALFAVLPFGVRSQAEEGEVLAGSDPGAPSAPRLAEKAIWTTLVAGPVLVLTAWLLPLAGL
jgi:predicted secreted protein